MNGDGGANILDAQQLARFAAGLSVPFPERIPLLGDVNGDGRVNVLDAQQVARFAVGLPGSGTGRATPGVCDLPEEGNAAPVVRISRPEDGAGFVPGERITFAGSADDPEDGELTGDVLVWESDRDGELGTGIEFSRSDLSSGSHTITLTATDLDGLSGSSSVEISVEERANLQITSLTVVPRGVLESATVEVDAEIRNAGSVDADGFDWELSAVSVATGQSTPLASGRIAGLAVSDTVAIPTQADLGPFPAGGHRLVLRVDAGDEVSEVSEEANERDVRLESYRRGYEIELTFLAETTDEQKAIFEDAAQRWSRIFTGDVPDIFFDGANSLDLSRCVEGGGQRRTPVDDLLILVRVESIDGVGGVLGRAGPCFIRDSDADPDLPPLPIVGVMEFDEADLGFLQFQGRLEATILHEMAHVLGLGTLWRRQALIRGRQTESPRFVGEQATRAFFEIGGDAVDGRIVPVENGGGPGTRDSHWEEDVFANELMTGFLNMGENPLSVVTIASFGDQFYAVDESEADPFRLESAGAAAVGGEALDLGDHLLRIPLMGVDRQGSVHPLERARERP